MISRARAGTSAQGTGGAVVISLALARRRQAGELLLEQQWLGLLELRDFTARQHAAFPRMARG